MQFIYTQIGIYYNVHVHVHTIFSLARVTRARIATPEASAQTKRRRSSRLAEVRSTISVGAEAAKHQLNHEQGKEERQRLLKDSSFFTEISTEEALAMKANLSLPWHTKTLIITKPACIGSTWSCHPI